jgi:hypothetical protein
MKDKICNFEFHNVSVEEVKTWLVSINNDKPPGSDNLDGQLGDNSGRNSHSYLPYLQFTWKCVPSGLEGSKSHSAT